MRRSVLGEAALLEEDVRAVEDAARAPRRRAALVEEIRELLGLQVDLWPCVREAGARDVAQERGLRAPRALQLREDLAPDLVAAIVDGDGSVVVSGERYVEGIDLVFGAGFAGAGRVEGAAAAASSSSSDSISMAVTVAFLERPERRVGSVSEEGPAASTVVGTALPFFAGGPVSSPSSFSTARLRWSCSHLL
jgi:hypothetical protein